MATDAEQTDATPGAPAALLVVISAKGGCGATLVATHLAVGQAAARRTCLVDLDVCKGDVAGFLDLPDDRSVNLLLERLDHVDDVLLRGSVTVHASGLHVLAQPYDLTELQHLTADETRTLLDRVRQAYELVIVDAGSRIDAVTLAAALVADEVVLLTTPDVCALRDAQRVLRLLRRLKVPREHVRLVVNKHGPGVPDDEIEAQLDQPVTATVEADEASCRRAETLGTTLSEAAPRKRVTEDLAGLWDRLHGERPTRPARLPWWWAQP